MVRPASCPSCQLAAAAAAAKTDTQGQTNFQMIYDGGRHTEGV